nr:MAG TPA: hypothetical protein [Caudoviricetes sp.]
MQHVQFSIIKCSFYAKNEIYRRGYTSFSYNFIHFFCMFYTIPAIYEIVQVRSLEFIRLLINLVKDFGLF